MSVTASDICSDTSKIKYPDKISAVARAIHLRRMHSRLLKAYRCKFCDCWHLTKSGGHKAWENFKGL